MGNRIQIRNGASIPGAGDLLSCELGFDTTNNILYIGGSNNNILDINISGNAATATSAASATQDSDGNAINTTYLKLTGGTLSDNLIISKASDNVGYYAERSDTNTKVGICVGTGGTNHGLYSYKGSNWIIYQDGNGAIYIPNTSISLGSSSASIVTLTSNTTLNLLNTVASSSTSTGALVVSGGAGIGGKLYVGNTLTVNSGGIAIAGGKLKWSSGTASQQSSPNYILCIDNFSDGGETHWAYPSAIVAKTFRSGSFSRASVSANSQTVKSVTFSPAFTNTPVVVAALDCSYSPSGYVHQCNVTVYNISSTGFSLRINNGSSSVRDLGAQWIAYGT